MEIINNQLNNGKVLIVEDDAILSTALAESLKKEKFEVVIVDNGLDVYDEVIKFKPNIILLDLIIPDVDGLTVLRQLKNNQNTANIPIITVSSADLVDSLKIAHDLGAYQCFLKDGKEVNSIIHCVNEKINK